MPKLTIVRGLPGSGKSTFARELSANTGAILIEPDSLLLQDGKYKYTQARYREAVKTMEEILCKVISFGADAIIADVFCTIAEVERIRRDIEFTAGLGGIKYKIVIHDMPPITFEESMKRNIHHVRQCDLKRMVREWEPW